MNHASPNGNSTSRTRAKETASPHRKHRTTSEDADRDFDFAEAVPFDWREVRARVVEEARRSPLVAIGVAVGCGLLLRGLLSSRVIRAALIAAAGYAAHDIVKARIEALDEERSVEEPAA